MKVFPMQNSALQTIPLARRSLLLLALLAGLAGCNYPGGNPAAATSPTLSVTQAYETVAARLTQAIALTPSPSLGASPTQPAPATTAPPSATTPAPTSLASALPSQTSAASTNCDLAAAGNPIDVTIPDDTPLNPGQAFTKTWRLQNAGTCTWTTSYKVQLFSGEAMGAAASIPLAQDVAPGQSIDISVDMLAPQTAGTYQGNWKLRNTSDAWFGIGPGGSSPFWVRIVVSGAATASPTATATLGTPPAATATPTSPADTATATSTPGIQAAGVVTLMPGDKINLDNRQINGGGEDLSYESNAEGKHLLVPVGPVTISAVGVTQPSLSDCQAASLGADPLTVEALSPGTYLCYRTGDSLPGRALISAFNGDTYVLTLDLLTWAQP